jgi:hypothetical protein
LLGQYPVDRSAGYLEVPGKLGDGDMVEAVKINDYVFFSRVQALDGHGNTPCQVEGMNSPQKFSLSTMGQMEATPPSESMTAVGGFLRQIPTVPDLSSS